MFSERDVDFILFAAEHPNDPSVTDQWGWMELAYRDRLAAQQRNGEQSLLIPQSSQLSASEHP